MGANTYLKDVESYGYSAQSATATALTQEIPGNSEARIAIRAFGFTCANVATALYFFRVLGRTTVNGAVASGASTVTITSKSIVNSGAIATADYIVLKMDDGSFHTTTVAGLQTSTRLTLTDALDDTLADGNSVYSYGVAADTGHIKYTLTVSTQNTKELEGGIFFGDAKGDPMMLYYLAAGATALATLDYLSVDYINS